MRRFFVFLLFSGSLYAQSYEVAPSPVSGINYDGVYFSRVNINRGCQGQCKEPFYVGEVQATFAAQPEGSSLGVRFNNIAYTDQDFQELDLSANKLLKLKVDNGNLRLLTKIDSVSRQAVTRLFNIKAQNSIFFGELLLGQKRSMKVGDTYKLARNALVRAEKGRFEGRAKFLGPVNKLGFLYHEMRYSIHFSDYVYEKNSSAAKVYCQGRFSYHDFIPAQPTTPQYRSFWFLNVKCHKYENKKIASIESTKISSFVTRLRPNTADKK